MGYIRTSEPLIQLLSLKRNTMEMLKMRPYLNRAWNVRYECVNHDAILITYSRWVGLRSVCIACNPLPRSCQIIIHNECSYCIKTRLKIWSTFVGEVKVLTLCVSRAKKEKYNLSGCCIQQTYLTNGDRPPKTLQIADIKVSNFKFWIVNGRQSEIHVEVWR